MCLTKSLTSNRRVGCWGGKLGCRADTLAPLSARSGGLQTADHPNGDLEIAAPCFSATSAPTDRTSQKNQKSRPFCPTFFLYKTVSAKGATFTLAWGSAPGDRKC